MKLVDIDSPYSPEEVCRRLQAVVRPKPRWFGRATSDEAGPEPAFQGSIGDRVFKVTRIIHYRNSFLPTIRGKVLPREAGARVHLLLTLHPAVAVFMALWLALFGYALILALLARPAEAPFRAILVLFGAALTGGGFYYEARKAERILRRCCGAAEQGDEADEAR